MGCVAAYRRRDNPNLATATTREQRKMGQRGDLVWVVHDTMDIGRKDFVDFVVVRYDVTKAEFEAANRKLCDPVTDLGMTMVARHQERLDLAAFRTELSTTEKTEFDKADSRTSASITVADGLRKTAAAKTDRVGR